MIDSAKLEQAERALSAASNLLKNEAALFNSARVDRDACEAYIRHHMEIVRNHLPDLDPRMEPAINTMLRHFLLVGVKAGREDS